MMQFARTLLMTLVATGMPSLLCAQTLAWDANTEPDLAGYRVYYGTQSGNYTTQVDVGRQTQYQPPQGFDWSRPLYFAVRAYNTTGGLSPYSTEIQWTPPATTTVTSLQANVAYPLLAGRQVTWTAIATNPQYQLEYRFYLYRRTAWTLMRDYGPGNTFTWTPSGADIGEPYRVQVWVRAVGSTEPYESWLGTPTFAVTGAPFEVSADVDFPTPPGNQVTWTAKLAATTTSPLEYRFFVRTQSGAWTVFREYATSNVAQWTAPATGTYAVQAWARRVGSTAQSEYTAATDFFEVSQTPLSVTGLSADVTGTAPTGTAITWTARARGGMSGPLQYQFWLYSAAAGWRLAQPYGPSPTLRWTPTWNDLGDQTVQVWVRSNGSTASYEAWRSSPRVTIEPAGLSLTTTSLFPVAPGSHVDWTAAVPDPTSVLEYQFWVYSAASATWTIARPYAPEPTFRWIPTSTGTFAVEAWARRRGSSVNNEVTRSTDFLTVTQGPAQIVSLTSNVSLPAPPGTSIRWTAAANGGTAGPLQYQFWHWRGGQWVLAQPYSALNTYTWTPTAADVGEHVIQVWVRSAGSTAAYETHRTTGVFRIE